MIDYSARHIAEFLERHNDGVVSKAVMKFALIIILNVLSIITIMLLLGYFTHNFKNSIIALIGFALLRFFSGGIHVKSAVHCIGISVILMSIIIYTPLPQNFEIWIQIFSSLLVLIFAPAYLEFHIRIKEGYIPFIKFISVCIILSNFYWDSSILTKCFFIQSLTLIYFRRNGGGTHETSIL